MGEREAVSLSTGGEKFRPSRLDRMDIPWSPRDPLRMITSPGAHLSGPISTPGISSPIPEVLINTPSPLPFCTTLVSPVTIFTPECSAAFFMERTQTKYSEIQRSGIPTEQAATILGVKPQTMRRGYCVDGCYMGLVPLKLPNRRLL